MSVSASIREVFGHFQNLNLLALLHDLRSDQTARRAWSTGARLCPVAHGLAAGQQVRELTILGQATDLGDGCDYAARQLGADPAAVFRFVRSWDEETLSRVGLFQQLQELWQERLADAEAVQALLRVVAAVPAEQRHMQLYESEKDASPVGFPTAIGRERPSAGTALPPSPVAAAGLVPGRTGRRRTVAALPTDSHGAE